ncbi:MAG: hypothetical protein AAF960_00005 [Bacteroidota bacterium]
MKKIAITWFSLLSFILLSTTSHSNTNPSRSATYDMMNEVYNDLKMAIGDQRRTWPTLEIRPGASSVLAYNKRKNIIYVDEQALAICRLFEHQERDAFAFLLAHEMTHFYQEHHWQEAGFATRFLSEEHHFEDHVADEKEADLFGAFITHLAGYQSIKIIPNLFDQVYNGYRLAAELTDYPTLEERKKTALEVCDKVKSLIQVFETANYLVALDEHLSAVAAYEYVLQFVKYKELYSNIGASLVAAAATHTEYGKTNFRYPIELDSDIPLRDGSDADKKELLQKAIEYLTIATQMDNQHYRTFVNLACAYTLDEQYENTKTLIAQLYPMVRVKKQVAELSIIQGIASAQMGYTENAKELFEEAKSLSSVASIQQLANENIALLKGEKTATDAIKMGFAEEKIGGIDLTYQNDFPFQTIQFANTFTYEENQLNFHETSTAALIHSDTEEKTVAILLNKDLQRETLKGIGVNDTYQDLKKVYSSPFKITNHADGYFLVVPAEKLIFDMNNRNQIVKWGVFEIY